MFPVGCLVSPKGRSTRSARPEALGFGRATVRPRGWVDADVEDLATAERAHIVRVLESCNWAIQGHGQAAERLGL